MTGGPDVGSVSDRRIEVMYDLYTLMEFSDF